MPIDKSTCLKFYKRPDIQLAIVEHARDKEVGVRYTETFGKRPDVLSYPRDIIELALRNATSFHASEERWQNPLALSSTSSKKDLDALRSGWDLVLDIDCAVMEYSRICADLIVKFLRYCEVKDVSVKYSGNKGFHIGVPFEAFPQKVGNVLTKDLFPEAPRKMALYIKENIKEELGRQILTFEKNISNIKEKVRQEDIIRYETIQGISVPKLDVEKFLEIDTILLASRHLYRMPYSLHEKSGLVSLPIDPDRVLEFEKSMAAPEKILTPMFVFLERNILNESARRLLVQAMDYEIKVPPEDVPKRQAEEMVIQSPITEDFFPPCMKLILQGLDDGKKRAVFCMANFLGKVGWSKTEIEEFLRKWNAEKNREPLREVYIKGQLAHFTAGERLPPNCNNEAYYKGIGVCRPDSFCSRIKNPANYTILKWRRHREEKSDEEEKKKRRRQKKEEEMREEEKKEETTRAASSPENLISLPVSEE
ncbi:hypothetical protein HYX14_00315 [Candidatus Woesearchaeota archaeon]|nr:hypothetical protein [Candidatus Woesearchaeota archaeon]